MKHPVFIYCVMALIVLSCGSSTPKPDSKAKIYTGDFAGDPIELSLSNLNDSAVKGISMHKGINSEMSGLRHRSNKGYVYVMKETGNNDYDGVFQFELDTALNLIFGSWQMSDTGKRTAVLYTLQPKLSQ
ncbi:MAG: hypothetical protein QM530_04040 [Phycisphaerales bacterium]|nr:hypothetical protein [Phycisphaerales bacterium]